MGSPIGSRTIFGEQLLRETDTVLKDPIFERSPVQTRLLQFLAEATVRGGRPPGQYEIAVDGLGRDPDFDLANDSYPRVQVSRLRANLDLYYARNAPMTGARIVIKPGKYVLDLKRMVQNETAPKVATVTSDFPAGHDDTGARSDMPITTEILDMIEGDLIQVPAPPLTPNGRRWRDRARSRLRLVLGLLSIVAVLILALMAALFMPATDEPGGASADTAGSGQPSLALSTDTSGLLGDGETLDNDIELALRTAQTHLADSFVAKPYLGESEQRPDYVLALNFGQERPGSFEVFLSLVRSDGDVLFTDRIGYTPGDVDAFDRSLTAALVYATSPTGAIASDQIMLSNEAIDSEYLCFLTMEGRRADGERLASTIDRCLSDYPDGAFAPFFLSRRAFDYFQTRKLDGRPIERAGRGWADLDQALRMDRFNPFARLTAAKVELANGNCSGARRHIVNAAERGSSYPALIAVLAAETSACPGGWDAVGLDEAGVRTMIATNPSPDPLLHLYLLMAALGKGDRESADALSVSFGDRDPPGMVGDTIALLHDSLRDPDFAKANEDRLRGNAKLFVWGDAGVDRIIATLIAIDNRPKI